MFDQIREEDIIDLDETGISNIDEISEISTEAKNSIRVYPHRAIYTDEVEGIVQDNTHAIITIKNTQYSLNGKDYTPFKELETDENGLPYFDLQSDTKVVMQLRKAMGSNISGKQILAIKEIVGTTTSKYSPTQIFSEGGNGQWIDFITLEKPFDKNDKKQRFYLVDTFQTNDEASIYYNVDIANIYDDDYIAELKLIDFQLLADNAQNYEAVFTENKFDNFIVSQDPDGSNKKYGFKATVPFTSWIGNGGIQAKGYSENVAEPISLETKAPLVPMVMNPIDNQNKMTWWANWFDYDVCMPLLYAKMFLTPAKLEVAFKTQTAPVDWIKDGSEFHQLIIDALTLSYAFASKFASFPRYTQVEVDNDNHLTASDVGQIKDSEVITSRKYSARNLSKYTEAKKAVDELFEQFIRENVFELTDEAYLLSKQIYVALSRFIYSSHSIASGNNHFHEIYLPWYLVPTAEMTLTKPSEFWTISPDITYKIKSRWFDVSATEIKPKSSVNLSDLMIVQADRKISMPRLPQTIDVITKQPNPDDIDTKSSKDLKYLFFIPIKTQADFEKLFLSEKNIQTDISKNLPLQETEWTNYGTVFNFQNDVERQKYIKDKMAEKFSIAPSKITILEEGTIEDRLSDEKSIPASWIYSDKGTGVMTHYNLDQKNQQIVEKIGVGWEAVPETAKDQWASLTSDQAKKFVSIITGQKEEAIQITNAPKYIRHYQHAGYLSATWTNSWVGFQEIKYKLKSERIKDIKLQIDARIVQLNLEDRKLEFDKGEWIYFVKSHNLAPQAEFEILLTTKNDLQIDRITEIDVSIINADYIKINLGIDDILINMFNKSNYNIGIEKILIL